MRLHDLEQRSRAAELRAARAEAEREDAEAVCAELREKLVQAERQAQTAETEVARLRREALQWQDNKDELVEAKSELVLQAEKIKTYVRFSLVLHVMFIQLFWWNCFQIKPLRLSILQTLLTNGAINHFQFF